MDSALLIHRLHFAFTITFHYLFPQLTMGLALLIVVLKSLALWKRDESYGKAAQFWGRIFALNFAMGVVTGLAATLLMVFPTGDGQGRMVAQHQPVTLAAMEGLFESAQGAPLAL